MQHDPALVDRMTFFSPTSGDRVGLSFVEPHSVDDLIRRRGMVKIWADATCGMFGRSLISRSNRRASLLPRRALIQAMIDMPEDNANTMA